MATTASLIWETRGTDTGRETHLASIEKYVREARGAAFSDRTSRYIRDKFAPMIVPITDNITINYGSSFVNASDLASKIPLLSKALQFEELARAKDRAFGHVSRAAFFTDLQVWEKTLPIELSFDIYLYTRTDPVVDVLAPYLSLCELAILSTKTTLGPGVSGTFVTPGLSFGALSSQAEQATTETSTGLMKTNRQKFVPNKRLSIHIPGLISLEETIVTKVAVEGSKEITMSRVPLFVKLSIELISLYSATEDDLRRIAKGVRGGRLTAATP